MSITTIHTKQTYSVHVTLSYEHHNIFLHLKLLTELIWYNDHCKEIQKLPFRVLVLHQGKQGNYGLLEFYILKDRATCMLYFHGGDMAT